MKLSKNTFPGYEAFSVNLNKILNKFTETKKSIADIIDYPKFESDVNDFIEAAELWKIDVNKHLNVVIEDVPDFLNKIVLFKKWENKKYFELNRMYESTFNGLMICKYDMFDSRSTYT